MNLQGETHLSERMKPSNLSSSQPTVWNDFLVWGAERGAEAVICSHCQFKNFIAMDNDFAGIEMTELSTKFGSDQGGVFDSLIIGHSALSNGQCHEPNGAGILGPAKELFNIYNTTFVNFDNQECSALAGCSQCEGFADNSGGYATQLEALTFINSPNKVGVAN